MTQKLTTLFLAAAVVSVTFFSAETYSQSRKPHLFEIAAGTRLRVRMEGQVSSDKSQIGDNFDAKLIDPVYSRNGVLVIPVGSIVTGRVGSVRPASKGGKPGTIEASFVGLALPNGMKTPINGSLTYLDMTSAKGNNEGAVTGSKKDNRNLIFIGGGAGGGALIGALIGGGTGAVIGGLAGGVGGLIGVKSKKGANVSVGPGTEFGIVMNTSVNLPRFAPRGYRYEVQPGDTLGIISKRFYGTSDRYWDIYNANRNTLANPSDLRAGQTLIIPE